MEYGISQYGHNSKAQEAEKLSKLSHKLTAQDVFQRARPPTDTTLSFLKQRITTYEVVFKRSQTCRRPIEARGGPGKSVKVLCVNVFPYIL